MTFREGTLWNSGPLPKNERGEERIMKTAASVWGRHVAVQGEQLNALQIVDVSPTQTSGLCGDLIGKVF